MLKPALKTTTIVLSLILAVAFIMNWKAPAYSFQAEDTVFLPKGNWSLVPQPDLFPGSQITPILVSSVTANIPLGGVINKVTLYNQSLRPITDVKLMWALYEENDMSTPVLKGETSMIHFSKPIWPEVEIELVRHIFSFAKIQKQLLKAGTEGLNGNYKVYIGASEIIYKDQTTWIRASEVGGNDNLYNIILPPLSCSGCPKQTCKIVGTIFQCDSSGEACTFCINTNPIGECTIKICNTQGGPGGNR